MLKRKHTQSKKRAVFKSRVSKKRYTLRSKKQRGGGLADIAEAERPTADEILAAKRSAAKRSATKRSAAKRSAAKRIGNIKRKYPIGQRFTRETRSGTPDSIKITGDAYKYSVNSGQKIQFIDAKLIKSVKIGEDNYIMIKDYTDSLLNKTVKIEAIHKNNDNSNDDLDVEIIEFAYICDITVYKDDKSTDTIHNVIFSQSNLDQFTKRA